MHCFCCDETGHKEEKKEKKSKVRGINLAYSRKIWLPSRSHPLFYLSLPLPLFAAVLSQKHLHGGGLDAPSLHHGFLNLHRNGKLERGTQEGADNTSDFKPADSVAHSLLTASSWILVNYLSPVSVSLWAVSVCLPGINGYVFFFLSFVHSSFLSA